LAIAAEVNTIPLARDKGTAFLFSLTGTLPLPSLVLAQVEQTDAEESLKLVRAGWQGGDKKYDYTAVLQAQQVLSQARLVEVCRRTVHGDVDELLELGLECARSPRDGGEVEVGLEEVRVDLQHALKRVAPESSGLDVGIA
jgi:hypothetical protein